MRKIGFNNEKYLKEQSTFILERASKFNNKLYLEFGGKLTHDLHAARILPGFDPEVKIRLLQKLQSNIDLILCIGAGDIERKKIRADFGITYDSDVLKLIDDLRNDWGIAVTAVVITRFEGQTGATQFINRLERRNVRVYTHRPIIGYPSDVEAIVSDKGFGMNPYIETTHPVVIVTAPGPGSGKMATCLNQLYHEHKRGVNGGYAKFETFPIWNLPLKHPVNIAYEAATADLGDFNQIDPYHLEAHGEAAINYNRDVEIFPVLKRILMKIMGKSLYESPTDMGVNRAGFAIEDDAVVREAATQEVIRRYFRYQCEYTLGLTGRETLNRIGLIMSEIGSAPEDRSVVIPSRQVAEKAEKKTANKDGVFCGSAIELADGSIVTGKNSPLLHASSSAVLNAIKKLADIPDKIHLLSPNILESINHMKSGVLKSKQISLDLEEMLIALSISATTNPTAQLCMEKLTELHGCQMHLTHIPTPGDRTGLQRLGIVFTSDPSFAGKNLFAGVV